MNTGRIGSQNHSYRQGVVLGLTMAEVILLLLFCLLIASSATLMFEKNQRATAERRLNEIVGVEGSREQLANDLLEEKRRRERSEWEKQEAAKNSQSYQALMDKLKQYPPLYELIEKTVNTPGSAEINEEWRRLVESYERGKKGGDRDNSNRNKWPPIINLSEADGFYFESGSAVLSEEFERALKEKVVPKIIEIAREYPDVNVIEVIGHTDEQRIKKRTSNLDDDILMVLQNRNVSSLIPADNAGLGLARALSIVTQLVTDSRLRVQGFSRILPLSGAQLIQVDQTLTHGAEGDVRERRRIEIRLRRYEPAAP